VPPVRLLRARLAHLGDQVRLLAEVRGQGVGGLEPGAAVNLVDRHMNDQVELVKRAPDLKDFELSTSHHADLDAVGVTHVGLLAIRRDTDQLARPPGEQRTEQLDEHGLLVSGHVAIKVRHGDQVQVVQDAVHTNTDADIEECRIAMLATVKRYRKRPHIITGQDVVHDLQGVADQDSHVLPNDRVVEAVELGNLAGVLGLLDRHRNLPERQATRHVLDGELEAHDPLNADSVAILVLIQLEQLQRITTQLLDISVVVTDASQVIVVDSVKFVFGMEQHFTDDHIDDLGRHDQVDLVALHVHVVVHGVGARLH